MVHQGICRHAKRDGQNWYGLANSLLGHAQQILQHSTANYCICEDNNTHQKINKKKRTLHITLENAKF
jgi:hypothetical protein